MTAKDDERQPAEPDLAAIAAGLEAMEARLHAALRPINRRLRDLENRTLLLCPTPEVAAGLQERVLRIGRLLRPQRARGVGKIRVGKIGDGGYVQLDDFEHTDAALSLGIGTEVSWDLDVAERGLTVLQFDHTVAGPPVDHPNFRFAPLRIGPQSGEGVVALSDAIERAAGRDGRAILKMDIEGAEWDALDATPLPVLARCRQIVCELHGFQQLPAQRTSDFVHRVLAKLHQVFGVVHVHANNVGPIIVLGNVPFFSTLEVTFANRADFDLEPSGEVFPTPLDSPNNPAGPDHFLGTFDFGPDPEPSSPDSRPAAGSGAAG